jgi:hypothetical protein
MFGGGCSMLHNAMPCCCGFVWLDFSLMFFLKHDDHMIIMDVAVN